MAGGTVMTLIAPTLQASFTDRLLQQRQASPQTVASYRDTMRLLLTFVHQQTGKTPARLDWDDLDAAIISAFLNHLEDERRNSTRTRNLRLTAIRSLFSYAALCHPEHALLIQRVLAIPPKRSDKRVVTFLTAAEIDALLAAPDQARWEGRRDRALMLLAIQAGLRVSELTSLNCADVTLGPAPASAAKAKDESTGPSPSPAPPRRSCGCGCANEPDNPATRCSPPGPDGGSAATPSRCGSAPTPPPPPGTARHCSESGSIRTSCATAAPCRSCKPASIPQ